MDMNTLLSGRRPAVTRQEWRQDLYVLENNSAALQSLLRGAWDYRVPEIAPHIRKPTRTFRLYPMVIPRKPWFIAHRRRT